jgi:hypothetical protein
MNIELGRTIVQNEEIRAAVAKSLQSLSTATVGADTIRAELRTTIRSLFPAEPTRAAIDAVTASPLWTGIMDDAQRILGETYFAAPRYLDGKLVDRAAARAAYEATGKAVAALSDDAKRLRRAAKKYRDNSVKQTVTACIPAAVDEVAETETAGVGAGAGEAEAATVEVDPSAILAAVDAWLATKPGKALTDNFFREIAKRQPK